MPKKPPQNAFYFFMQNFREQQRKKGINYGGMKDVAEAAGPLWKEASPEEKLRYEGMAKKAKNAGNVNERKFTSQGVPYSQIEAEEQRQREAEEREKKDIKNMVITKSIGGAVVRENFYVMDVNCYCYCKSLQSEDDNGESYVIRESYDIGESRYNRYVIAECSILRFNLQDGIHDDYHVMINPKNIPLGYLSDIKASCEKLGLEMPSSSKPPSEYLQIMAIILEYTGAANYEKTKKLPPPIFTMPDKVIKVQSFINEICKSAGVDKFLFRIYRLDQLFYTLINSIRTREDEGFPRESLALAQLKKDPFDYNPGLGCEHHESGDKPTECTQARAKRWTYTIFDHCCPLVGIELLPDKHLPADFDTDRIMTFNEQIKQRAGPSVGNNQSFNSSALSDSLNESPAWHSVYSGDSARAPAPPAPPAEPPKRTHEPLRKPKTVGYSRQLFGEPPELSDSNFPTLSMGGAGRGRGSGSLNAKMDKMRLG